MKLNELIMDININEVKKHLYKTKQDALYTHYENGNLYYTIELEDGRYQFPIAVTEIDEDTGDLILAKDLGITAFGTEMKASSLNRWVVRAIEGDNLIKVG